MQSNNMAVFHLHFISFAWLIFHIIHFNIISTFIYLFSQRIPNIPNTTYHPSISSTGYQAGGLMLGRVSRSSALFFTSCLWPAIIGVPVVPQCLQPVCSSWPLTSTRHFLPRNCSSQNVFTDLVNVHVKQVVRHSADQKPSWQHFLYLILSLWVNLKIYF